MISSPQTGCYCCLFFDICSNHLAAVIFFLIFFLHQLRQLSDSSSGKKLFSVDPLKQKLDMCYKSSHNARDVSSNSVSEASLLQFPRIFFHQIRKLHCIPNICSIFCVQEMKCDKSRLILRQAGSSSFVFNQS